MGIADKIQTADWKKEKHAPVIECPDTVPAGAAFEVKVSVGKEIPHPNTLEHHICWIQVYFSPEGDKFVYDLGRFEFNAHGEAENLTEPAASLAVKVGKPGVLHAVSFCNIHGLWESSKTIGIG